MSALQAQWLPPTSHDKNTNSLLCQAISKQPAHADVLIFGIASTNLYCYPRNLTKYESHVKFIIHNLYSHQKVNISARKVSLHLYRIQTGHEIKHMLLGK